MRLANINERAIILDGEQRIDVAERSVGRFGPTMTAVLADWESFRSWAAAELPSASRPNAALIDDVDGFGPPSPEPAQVFAIGMNYADHVAELGMETPTTPTVFTKFRSSLTGPHSAITLSSASVDWEVELVVVMGREARDVDAADAWDHVAGVTIGQDISDRVVQWMPPTPQFSVGKSFHGYGPMGPVLVTVDELDDPDDLEIGCSINGVDVQRSRTSQMVFSVPTLIEHLSRVVTLLPGDVIFTGTPAGVGAAAKPQRFLVDGDVLVSDIEGLGSMSQAFVAAAVSVGS